MKIVLIDAYNKYNSDLRNNYKDQALDLVTNNYDLCSRIAIALGKTLITFSRYDNLLSLNGCINFTDENSSFYHAYFHLGSIATFLYNIDKDINVISNVRYYYYLNQYTGTYHDFNTIKYTSNPQLIKFLVNFNFF